MGYYVYVYIYGIYHNDKCGPTNPTMVVHKQKVQDTTVQFTRIDVSSSFQFIPES